MAKLRAAGTRVGSEATETADVELDEAVCRIGRGTDNDVVVDDPAVSRAHARVEREAGVYRVVDVGSTNGTSVDGVELRPWQPVVLSHGSTIDVAGAAQMRFLLSEQERAGGDAATTRRIAERDVRLTPAEQEVLELLFVHYDEGRPAPRLATLKEVAERRFTSTAAVKMVLQGLYDKFDLDGPAERNKEALALRAQQWKITRTRF
jgi:DNA-binding CsgD family transcriptional regulator